MVLYTVFTLSRSSEGMTEGDTLRTVDFQYKSSYFCETVDLLKLQVPSPNSEKVHKKPQTRSSLRLPPVAVYVDDTEQRDAFILPPLTD